MLPTPRWSIRVLLCCAVLAPSTADAADPVLVKTDLFAAGEGGYVLYRIPGVVVTPKNTILAYCEARKKTGDDWDAIDVLMRRSTDGGKTWDEARKVAAVEGPVAKNPVALKQKLGKEGDVTIDNPVAVVERKTGVVHFLYCVEYMRCHHMVSDDDGKTFGKPVDITPTFDAFRRDYDWKVCATGPGHGIELRNGRLLVPVWLSTGTGGGGHRPSCMSVIYSDDGGKTWERGDITAKDPEPKNPNETTAVELSDGSVLLNIRTEAEGRRRAVSVSADGATRWSTIRFDDQLADPVCMASIVRYSAKPSGDRNRILFSNPDNAANNDRKNLTIKLSYDEAKTWPTAKTLEAGASGYSDLAVGPDGAVYCFYERGSLDGNRYRTKHLTLARLNLEWLTDGKDTPTKAQP